VAFNGTFKRIRYTIVYLSSCQLYCGACMLPKRTRTNTNPIDTEACAAGRSRNARALRKTKQVLNNSRGGGDWPNPSRKARYLWVLCTPQDNKEEGARAKTLRNSFLVRGVAANRKAPLKIQTTTCKRAACGLAVPPNHRAKPMKPRPLKGLGSCHLSARRETPRTPPAYLFAGGGTSLQFFFFLLLSPFR